MKPSEVVAWATIAAMLLAGGMFLGRIEQRIRQLESKQLYLHGDIHVPDN